MRIHDSKAAVTGVLAAAICLLPISGAVLVADVKDEGTYLRVTGTLEKTEANGVRVDAGDGKSLLVGLSPTTTREIVGKGDEEFLIEKVPVLVRGHLADKDTTIADAHLTIMLDVIKPRIEALPLPSDKTHILIAGFVAKSSPLEVIATNQILNAYVLDSSGRRSPPRSWAQTKFKIQLQKEGSPTGPITVNLGGRIDLVKPGAYVSASVPKNLGVARHLYVRQDDLLDVEAFKKLVTGKKGK